MTNTIDNAIARLQDISQAMTSITIKSAPDYPIENADPCPFSLAYIESGTAYATNASSLQMNVNVNVDFLFSRVNLKQAYQQCDAVAFEFAQRLAGDPTLTSYVDTVRMDRENPLSYSVSQVEWGKVLLILLRFVVQFKTLETPVST